MQRYSEIRTLHFSGDIVQLTTLERYMDQKLRSIYKRKRFEGINEARNHTHRENAGDNETKVTCKSELCECKAHSATEFLERAPPQNLHQKLKKKKKKKKEEID